MEAEWRADSGRKKKKKIVEEGIMKRLIHAHTYTQIHTYMQ